MGEIHTIGGIDGIGVVGMFGLAKGGGVPPRPCRGSIQRTNSVVFGVMDQKTHDFICSRGVVLRFTLISLYVCCGGTKEKCVGDR